MRPLGLKSHGRRLLYPEIERQATLEKMRALQQQMRAPTEEMRTTAKEANERMMSILNTAFKNNLAIQQKG